MPDLTTSLLSPQKLFEAVEQMLTSGHDAKFTVVGSSMWPLLRSRKDQVVLRKVNSNELKKGDIVLFQPNEERYILHRITRIKNGKLRITGDNNCFHDGGEFPPECVKGKVVALIRDNRQIDCGKVWVRLFGAIWIWLYPVRPFLLRVIRKIFSQRKRML